MNIHLDPRSDGKEDLLSRKWRLSVTESLAAKLISYWKQWTIKKLINWSTSNLILYNIIHTISDMMIKNIIYKNH